MRREKIDTEGMLQVNLQIKLLNVFTTGK